MKRIFYIEKYALWPQTKNTPDVSFIPPFIRRRLTAVERIGLFLAHQLEPLPDYYQVVFSSRFGEWQQTIDLISQFHNEKEMSPSGFSHSVHNAMPAMLSLLTKETEAYTSIAAGEKSLESGLLESFCSPKPVLFLYAEEATPDFYTKHFSTPFLGHGIGLILSPEETENTAKISAETNNNNPFPMFSFKTKVAENAVKISVETNKNTPLPPLSFETLAEFLEKGEALSTSGFSLRKEK